MTSEATVTKKIIEHLKNLRRTDARVWWLKIHGHAMQRAGVPDLLVLLNGEYLWVEIKRPGCKPSPLQEHEMRAILAAGGRPCWVTSLEEFVGHLAGT